MAARHFFVQSDKETKQRKRFHRSTLSVHSVQFSFMGAPKARCSQEHRMFEPLLLANTDSKTLRPVRSRASTLAPQPARPHVFRYLRLLGGLATWFEVRTNSVVGSRRIARGAVRAGSLTGGEAWGIRVRRKRGSHIRGSCEHRSFGAPMKSNCTLWTLRVER